MAGKSNGGLLALLALGGIGAYFLWKNSAQAATAAGSAAAAGAGSAGGAPGSQDFSPLPGSMAVTSDQVASAGTLWDSLTPAQSISSGYINFPSGSQAAASLFPTRMDSNGNYYVQWAGQTYKLGAMDANGNWPAVLAGS